MPAMTRGPLPARVYWTRRIFVLGTALLLVFGIARLLGNGSDAADDGAAQLTADTTTTSASPSAEASATAGETGKPGKGGKNGRKTTSPDPTPTLAAPTGTCSGADVAVTPQAKNAVGGRPVLIVLQLRTMVSEACTWRVGPDALAVSITSGDDDIWSSRECRKAIPVREVVVRKAVTTNVGVTWSAKRSDETCSRFTDFAMPGWYHVTAAALGGEPSDLQFELVKPTPATITRTITPSATASATGRPITPSGKPSNKPSGAVEPD
ncbi:hypothetical protein [Nocardioides caricicola]|uniref:DUF4232 domain-containing protein n=1 Tax=Nocardioides caricicola TaxID=634770 RepID=A0ABW0N3W8_9ACTN